MGLKISYKHPDFPKDQEFDLRGFGLIKNGGSKTLSKEEEEAAVALHGMSVKDYFKGNEMAKVEGTTELSSSEVSDLKEGGE